MGDVEEVIFLVACVPAYPIMIVNIVILKMWNKIRKFERKKEKTQNHIAK